MVSSMGEDSVPKRTGRLKRRLKWFVLTIAILMMAVAYVIQDDVRTLASLRRIEGTNAYMMDYYGDYNAEQIRTEGIDVGSIENSFIDIYFSAPVAYLAKWVKTAYLSNVIEPVADDVHHCSTVAFRNTEGEVLLGRNFDWKHNACLILNVHRAGTIKTTAVIDLAYLNLDRTDLDETSLIDRIPLLFAPYYVMDGMNQHGVAISDMSLADSRPPNDSTKPDILHSTVMRLILDYAKTTEEAVKILKQYNIRFVESPCHYLLADAQGVSAVVEFIDGEMLVTYSTKNWQVCTNSRISGVTEEQCDLQCKRYRQASERLENLNGEVDASGILEVMDSVAVDNWTMWTSVYNLSTGEFLLTHRKRLDQLYRGQPFTPNKPTKPSIRPNGAAL